MFGLGGWELAIIVIFGFLIFGPDKLPQMARTIGRVVRQFRNAQEQMNKVIKAEVYDPLSDLEPLANPFAGISLDGSKDPKKTGSDKKISKSTDTKKVEAKPSDKLKPADKDKAVDKTVSSEKDGASTKSKATKSFEADAKPASAADKVKSAPVAAAKTTPAAAKAKTTPAAATPAAAKPAGDKKPVAAASTGEGFAQRRARLEAEHAKAKAAKDTQASDERKEDGKSD